MNHEQSRRGRPGRRGGRRRTPAPMRGAPITTYGSGADAARRRRARGSGGATTEREQRLGVVGRPSSAQTTLATLVQMTSATKATSVSGAQPGRRVARPRPRFRGRRRHPAEACRAGSRGQSACGDETAWKSVDRLLACRAVGSRSRNEADRRLRAAISSLRCSGRRSRHCSGVGVADRRGPTRSGRRSRQQRGARGRRPASSSTR